MHIQVLRPEGFSNRVSLVTVKITDPIFAANRIGFDVPVIENWLFRKTENADFYMTPLSGSTSQIRGIITNGEWQCILQSNGVSEEENPISLETVKDILSDVIGKASPVSMTPI